jgi:RNA polymerase sigma-70 factor, ECF subfamily
MALSALSSTTSASLLSGLRADQQQAWQRFSRVFGPVLYIWVRQGGIPEQDAADVVQAVYQSVYVSLARFRKEQPGERFRDWLWTITKRRMCDHFRSIKHKVMAAGGTEAGAAWLDVPDRFPADEPDAYESETALIVREALEMIRHEFRPSTWQACLLTVCEGQPATEVAQHLHLSVGAVYMARSRVLKRLKEVLDGLV